MGASLLAHVILSGLKMAVCVSARTVGKVTAPTAVVAKSSLEAREGCNSVVSKDIMRCALNRATPGEYKGRIDLRMRNSGNYSFRAGMHAPWNCTRARKPCTFINLAI